MTKYISALLLTITLAFLMSGCGYDEVDTPAPIEGRDYAPLTVGTKRTYRITDTTYTGVNTFSTSKYWMQEEIAESFTDLEGQTAFKAVRSRLMDTTNLNSWEVDSVIVYKLNSTHYERVQNNYRIVDLIFPVLKGKNWNPNSLNVNEPAAEQYTYQEVAVPAMVNGVSYDNTLLVTQDNSTPLLFDVISKERYAKNVGLVFRYRARVAYSVVNGNLTGDPSGGSIIYQSLIKNP